MMTGIDSKNGRTTMIPYDKSAPRKVVTVSINADLAARAKALGVDLSATLEIRLAELVAMAEGEWWLAENRRAIEAYNRRVAKDPILSDLGRLF